MPKRFSMKRSMRMADGSAGYRPNFSNSSAQIDSIGYVPDDIAKMVRNVKFDTEAVGRPPVDVEFARRSGNDGDSVSPENSHDKDSLAGKINSYYDEVFYSGDGLIGILFRETIPSNRTQSDRAHYVRDRIGNADCIWS